MCPARSQLNSCTKDGSTPPTYPYNVRLTDAPGPYNAVNIDLQGIEVTELTAKLCVEC